jgi:hypothetical protein
MKLIEIGEPIHAVKIIHSREREREREWNNTSHNENIPFLYSLVTCHDRHQRLTMDGAAGTR